MTICEAKTPAIQTNYLCLYGWLLVVFIALVVPDITLSARNLLCLH